MEHNLGDTLNLESALGNMDFDHSGVVVNEADIDLESGTQDEDIPMEFENIKEEQMMMDTGYEEIIVSDFIGDQFTLQEYCIQQQQEKQPQENETVVQANQLNLLTSQAESMIDFQYEPENIKVVKQESQQQPKYITVKASNTPVKNIAPKQVMIAPKPPNFPSSGAQTASLTKQYAIAPKPAPKPVQLVKSSVMKVSLANLVHRPSKPVLAQFGGKLLMLPAAGAQKIKLVPASSSRGAVQYVKTNDQQAQLIATKVSQASKQTKPVLTKVTVQGQQSNVDSSNQPAVLTKLVPVSTTTSTLHARYVMQQKTVPISLPGNKVILTSPTKQSNLNVTKKQQLVTVKSPSPKLLPAPTQAATMKKVVISANQNQNMILKTTAPTKTVGSNESLLITQGQRPQQHSINVSGKGVQYIRLVTNNQPAKPRAAVPQANTFMVADAKGNFIPITSEKMANNQRSLIVITGNTAGANKGTSKTPKKLVRLAPVGSKSSQIQQMRSPQSLLAPISPIPEPAQLDDSSVNTSKAQELTVDIQDVQRITDGVNKVDQVHNVKENNVSRSLLVQNTEIHRFGEEHSMSEVTVDFERRESSVEDLNTSEDQDSVEGDNKQHIHPLIVIPSNYDKQRNENGSKEKTLVFIDNESEDTPLADKSTTSVGGGSMVSVEAEIVPYLSPSPPPLHTDFDNDMVRSNELGRPRKACNCTKSQCLKLYCDCFANGEFCNNCNCNNCHNNLDNEELRQKAIRACLDRNPNAFRPKIGKARFGGPEPVRRHTKGCNCKRSGCLKNYCECFEAKIECTAVCKCVGCRNVEDAVGKRRGTGRGDTGGILDTMYRPSHNNNYRLPCSFMTTEVIEAVCQCLIAAAVEGGEHEGERMDTESDPMKDVIEEFARCLQDIIGASHQAGPVLGDE